MIYWNETTWFKKDIPIALSFRRSAVLPYRRNVMRSCIRSFFITFAETAYVLYIIDMLNTLCGFKKNLTTKEPEVKK